MWLYVRNNALTMVLGDLGSVRIAFDLNKIVLLGNLFFFKSVALTNFVFLKFSLISPQSANRKHARLILQLNC